MNYYTKYQKYKGKYLNKIGGMNHTLIKKHSSNLRLDIHYHKCKDIIDNIKSNVYNNNYLKDLMEKMLEEVAQEPKLAYNNCKDNYTGYNEFKVPNNIDEYFKLVLRVVTSAPVYYGVSNPFNGLPLLQSLMKTLTVPSGFIFYGNYIINKFLFTILELWRQYLDGPDSRYVLTKEGWLGMNNIDDYKIDKKDKYYGFKSWNDFFIREFKDIDKIRPLSSSLVVSGCDCHIVNFKTNLKLYGDFLSVKGDTYSLQHILQGVDDHIVQKFVGGTLLQGFLDAENYHRYHSPITGKLVQAFVTNGTYYLLKDFENINGNHFCGQKQVVLSEPYFANIQTRGIFIFKTKEIGYVAYVVIGMIEVSSCILYDHLIGSVVNKGQEVGYFQYGGSTNLVIFEKKYADKLNFYCKKKNFNYSSESLTHIRSKIADLK